MYEIVVPILDQTTTEVHLLQWLKSEGETVSKGEVVCEIETDKATVEIEASADGILHKILIESGSAIPPLTIVALVGDVGESVPDIDPFYKAKTPETGARVGPASAAQEVKSGPTSGRSAPRKGVLASPRARRLAEEHGMDLSAVVGTGPHGRILEEDVEKVLEAVPASGLSRAAQATVRRVSHSWQNIPHFYTSITVELTNLVAQKKRASDSITFTDFFARAIASALEKHPTLNGHWTDNGPEIVPEVHLGLVVQTDRGLIIPTLTDLHSTSLDEIAERRARLVQQAHDGKLSAIAMTNATFTISNIGPGNIDHFTAIINPPQLAILSVGSVKPRPFVEGTELTVRPTAMFTFGADHRAIDGRLAAAFLETLKGQLEEEA